MKKREHKRLLGEGGFTLVEIVLYITISAIVLNLTAQTLISQIQSYDFVSKRKNALSDARYAINRIAYDLMRLETDDLTAFDEDSINFLDMDDAATSYHFQDGHVYKGLEILVPNVNSFVITGYDEAGDETAAVADVRSFKITIITEPRADEGQVELSTTVTPRSFMYAGYE